MSGDVPDARSVRSVQTGDTAGPPAATAVSPPQPQPNELTDFFWAATKRHQLMILRCDVCKQFIHPPAPVCRFCLSVELSPAEVSGLAKLYSWTIVEQAAHPFFADRVPFVYSVVELEEQSGLRMVTNIVDCSHHELQIGMPLHVRFEQVAPELVLPMFTPIAARAKTGA